MFERAFCSSRRVFTQVLEEVLAVNGVSWMFPWVFSVTNLGECEVEILSIVFNRDKEPCPPPRASKIVCESSCQFVAKEHIVGNHHMRLCGSFKHCTFQLFVPIVRQTDRRYFDALAQIMFCALLDISQLLIEDAFYLLVRW